MSYTDRIVDDICNLRDSLRGHRFSEDEAGELLHEVSTLYGYILQQRRQPTTLERIEALEARLQQLAEERVHLGR